MKRPRRVADTDVIVQVTATAKLNACLYTQQTRTLNISSPCLFLILLVFFVLSLV